MQNCFGERRLNSLGLPLKQNMQRLQLLEQIVSYCIKTIKIKRRQVDSCQTIRKYSPSFLYKVHYTDNH